MKKWPMKKWLTKKRSARKLRDWKGHGSVEAGCTEHGLDRIDIEEPTTP